MMNKLQIRRSLLLLAFLAAAFGGLAYRLVDLQVFRHAELSRLADDNTQREYWQSPRRGDILDVNGNILATSIEVKTVCADPALIGNQQMLVARTLAPILHQDVNDLAQKLLPRIKRTMTGEFVTNGLHYARLAKDVSLEDWSRITNALVHMAGNVDESKLSRDDRRLLYNLRHRAIYAEPDQMRIYPNGSLAAQVLGFPGMDEYKIDGHLITQITGRDGIELSMQKALSGVPGWKQTEIDRAHHEIVALRDEDVHARDGLNVVLTIDSAVQHIVETAMAKAWKEHTPKGITGIVMRPSTGEILAMASFPNYDPNRPSTITPAARDRVITDVMEPGSTFKIVVVSGALNSNVVTLNEKFNCENGHFAYGGRVLHDAEPHGILTTEGIITKSSNIGAAKIGIKLGEQGLYDYAFRYGFGQLTGIPLPGESRGILHPVKDWSKVSIAQIPMGHGVAVTRLQMLYAMAAIANHGWLMHPMLVKCLQDRNGNIVQRYAPERVRQVVSDATAQQMIQALKTVPTPEGTAPNAALKDYVVAGKTGTAEKVEHGTYVHGKYFSSFIGFFPADNPQLCISVVMDEPKDGHYGGQVCGPVFHEIAERCASYLNIPPDPSRMTNSPALVVENGSRKL